MPIRTIPGTDVRYYLIAYNKWGDERDEDEEKLSAVVTEALADGGYTDVFIFSHGWKGDVPAAIVQYDAWIGAMLACAADRENARRVRPGFRPLLIGLHWPSLPFGDESLVAAPSINSSTGRDAECRDGINGSAREASADRAMEPLLDTWTDRIADTPPARDALHTIFAAAAQDIEPDRMPAEVAQAYYVLDRESGLGAEGVAGSPDADREPFDPITSYDEARHEIEHYGGTGIGGLLFPLRQLSFWQMKARARTVGESGGYALLQALREAAGPETRIHLMGHSFGCIVVSSLLGGAGRMGSVPVDSLFLVQGALSLWSYCSSIPEVPTRSGYFHSVVRDEKVRGPIVSTYSRFDTAVRVLYPQAAGIAGQVEYAPATNRLPKYGGIGTFGIQGDDLVAESLPMTPLDEAYHFRPGRIYNLDASQYINNGSGLSGAHNDIAHTEVAHAFWSAVLTGDKA